MNILNIIFDLPVRVKNVYQSSTQQECILIRWRAKDFGSCHVEIQFSIPRPSVPKYNVSALNETFLYCGTGAAEGTTRYRTFVYIQTPSKEKIPIGKSGWKNVTIEKEDKPKTTTTQTPTTADKWGDLDTDETSEGIYFFSL